jgi:hypothetical protein
VSERLDIKLSKLLFPRLLRAHRATPLTNEGTIPFCIFGQICRVIVFPDLGREQNEDTASKCREQFPGKR